MSTNNAPTLLVTGASGHLGQRVVELLLEANASTIVATTRTPEKLSDLSQRGIIVRQADFNDSASLTKAFAGVDRLLLISTDALDKPGLRLQQHQTAIKAAEAAGVSHVLYTSVVISGPDSEIIFAPDHHKTEESLTASQLNWTILRNNIYTDVLPGSLSHAMQMGHLFNAAKDGKLAYITREDCAQAAAAALLSSFDGRKVLNITGPEALSQADLVNIVNKTTEMSITYVPIELDVYTQNLISAGLPEHVVELLASLDKAAAQGQFGTVSNDFEELTGRKPMTVSDFLTANREALIPQTAQS